MRLVIDGHRLTAQRTGVGRCLESLLAEWSNSSWPLEPAELVLRDPAGRAWVPDSPGLTVSIRGSGWPGLLWETLILGRSLRPGDLLLAPANLIPPNWRGPSVLILYDTLPWSVPEGASRRARLRLGWRYRLAARRASRIVVPSHATAAEVVRVHRVDPERIVVVYPGPEPIFQPLEANAARAVEARRTVGIGDAPFFLFVGKRSARRHVPEILQGFAAHRERWPDHRLIFVGPEGGSPLPHDDRSVVAAGHVSEAVLHGLLASAIALLYPSDWEGFGLPVVEAMACGTPVVTLRNSALAESGGEAAVYLDHARPEDLARTMRILSAEPEVRRRIVEAGLRQAARFSRRAFAAGVAAEIERVASNRSEP